MAQNPRTPRYGEARVDCAAAQAAYDAAKTDGSRFATLKEMLGSGQLSRILGRDRTGQGPRQFAIVHRTNAEIFAKACGIPVERLLVEGTPLLLPAGGHAEHDDRKKEASAPPLKLLPLRNVNFVYLGSTNHKNNARFSFKLRFNLINDSHASILTGFSAHYIASDGCYCLNMEHEIFFADKSITTSENDFNFKEPVSIAANSIMQLAYRRVARPPLPVQAPTDCDNGDVRLTYSFYSQNTERTVQRYFRFERNGDLSEIDIPREPPVLSDSRLKWMLEERLITDEEYQKASTIPATDRYHIVAFPPRYCQRVIYHPEGFGLEVTPELRAFLIKLYDREVRHWADRA